MCDAWDAMTKLHRTTCILGLCTAAVVGCAATHGLNPPADCSPVDEGWIDTAPRCGGGMDFHTFNLPVGADCQVVDGNFEYAYAPARAVPEIGQYRAVTGYINFFYATNLNDISGLRNLEHTGQFTFQSNPITDLRALGNLRVVTNALHIVDMPALTSLEGLVRLRSVGGDLFIMGNPRLTSLRGLESLCRVGGTLRIYDNPLLPQSEVEALLDRIEVGGEVIVTNPGP